MEKELSPSERLTAFKNKHGKGHVSFRNFENSLDFPLDDFQIEAMLAIEEGKSVLVAAPTGAGKTIVGEFTAQIALNNGKKSFYTTPIKALSNQKYQEFCERFGKDNVGLLTGDASINSESSIVVMTTEVLRNMIYSNSTTLLNLQSVIMDEVHYLADRFRGAVWEEVLIHLPESVQILALSATVSNAEEFGDWISTVRGETKVIVSEHRPIPLFQQVLIGNRLFELFSHGKAINPEVINAEKEIYRNSLKINNASKKHSRDFSKTDLKSRKLTKPELIEKLQANGLLPTIIFIFSRIGCDRAFSEILHSKIRLNTKEEIAQIREIVAQSTSFLPNGDLSLLGFYEWQEGLERGVAVHHAGLLPIFKETVEKLFKLGLIKVVFATETLALGINMPAKSVYLEKLSKYNGQGHVAITSGEFTQLTGRAGRRGIDIEGHSVVSWYPEIDIAYIASLASTRTYPLRSSFSPSYNMAINLVRQMGSSRARKSLESSFAQYQADKAVITLVKQRDKNLNLQKEVLQKSQCHLGDFSQYFNQYNRLKSLEKNIHSRNRREREQLSFEIEDIQKRLSRSPIESCKDYAEHLRNAIRAARIETENVALNQRIENRTSFIARRFDQLNSILVKLGYLDEEEKSTNWGEKLSEIYGEKDLLICQSLRNLPFDKLSAPEFVGIISLFTYEPRSINQDDEIKIPKGITSEMIKGVIQNWVQIHNLESEMQLDPISEPEAGFLNTSYRWAQGHSLTAILNNNPELTVGDFVRQMKQIIDLIRQIRGAFEELRNLCEQSLEAIDRGVLKYIEQ